MNDISKKMKRVLCAPVKMSATDWLVDCVIALGAFGFGVVQLALSANLLVPDPFTRMMLGIHRIGPSIFEIFATLLICAPLILRRKFPWPCFVSTLLLWMLFDISFAVVSLSMVPVWVALFTLALEKGDMQTLVAGGCSMAAIAITQILSPSNGLSSLFLFQNSCMVIAVAFAGNALYARQGRMAAVEAQAKELAHAKEAEASKRVEEERVRIARELHDITAHSLSAIGIQAAVAERMIGKDDNAAVAAVSEVRSISKAALADMRSIVGVLRGTPVPETAPIMGTSSVEELVEYLKSFKIECELDMSGYERSIVPSHIDIALFKIAREAVTNIARHSGAKHASIRLVIEETIDPSGVSQGVRRRVRLVVSDDGKGITGEQLSIGGHGLSGMRERAQVLGGSVKVINHASTFDSEQIDELDFTENGTTLDVRIPL